MKNKPMTPPAAPFVELDALYEKATKGPWRVNWGLKYPRIKADDYYIMESGPYSVRRDQDAALIVALVNAYPALKAAHAAAATAARNDALEEAARVLDTTFPDDWSEWAAAKIRALAAQGKG